MDVNHSENNILLNYWQFNRWKERFKLLSFVRLFLKCKHTCGIHMTGRINSLWNYRFYLTRKIL